MLLFNKLFCLYLKCISAKGYKTVAFRTHFKAAYLEWKCPGIKKR